VKRKRNTPHSAFTLIELLTIVTVIAVVAALVATAGLMMRRAKARAIRINCVCDMKQCALAFTVWSGDNNGKFPMQVSTNFGGTLELVPEGNAFRHFQVMSNELSTPMAVSCPADTRMIATNFSSGNFASDFSDQKISYFVGVDASTNSPRAWLCGDRNITNGISPSRGHLTLATGQSAGWTSELHDGCGNVAFSDGSVLQISNRELRDTMRKSNGWTNRIILPE
jgi:hypothetical protein